MIMLQIVKFNGSPRIPDYLSDQAKDFLSHCLCVNPRQRWNVKKLREHKWVFE